MVNLLFTYEINRMGIMARDHSKYNSLISKKIQYTSHRIFQTLSLFLPNRNRQHTLYKRLYYVFGSNRSIEHKL